jgi:hypothetical protein
MKLSIEDECELGIRISWISLVSRVTPSLAAGQRVKVPTTESRPGSLCVHDVLVGSYNLDASIGLDTFFENRIHESIHLCEKIDFGLIVGIW